MNVELAVDVDREGWNEMQCVWLLCVEEVSADPVTGERRTAWVPRQDLPPAFDEHIARAFAADQTVRSERIHEARAFEAAGSSRVSSRVEIFDRTA